MDQHDFDMLKARVADLEDKMRFIFGRLNIEYIEGDMQQMLTPKIRELLRQGNKIEAIKVYRELYNVGLAEAKQEIDRLEQSM